MHDLAFVIDSDVRRRASICYFLNNEGIFAEPFETIEEFLHAWPRSGVVLIHNDERAVASLMEQICSLHSWLPIVAFSEEPATSTIVDGAIGYAAWPGCGATLIKALRESLARTGPAIASGSRQRLAMAEIDKLSVREREVLAGMVEGLSNRLMGEHLGISPRTVELHRANLLAKLGAKHSTDAIRLAIRASLAPFRAGAPEIA
ncbi:MAG TPA: LuxR C-terminal-related transcriptional regulator [Sphingomicrobium sp.]